MKGDMKKKRHQVIIQIDEEIHTELKIFCIKNNITIRGLVRELLINNLNITE